MIFIKKYYIIYIESERKEMKKAMEMIKCPYCGREIEIWHKIDWLDGTYSVQGTCPQCGRVYIDVNAEDIVIGEG